MKFDFERYEYLWKKKDKTEKEDNEFKRMYFMSEMMSGLEEPDSLWREDV